MIGTGSRLHRLILLDAGLRQHEPQLQHRLDGIFRCFQQFPHRSLIQTVGFIAVTFQPLQKLIHRIRILDTSQPAHLRRQRCLRLCIQRQCCLNQLHVNTDTPVVDLLIQIKLFPDKIRHGETRKPLVDCQLRLHILLVICLEGFPFLRSIGRCVELRNAVNGIIGNAKILDERLALRHLLLFQFQRSTCRCQSRRQTERPAMDHGTLPADWTEIITDGIGINAVAAEDLRILLAQISGKTYTLKLHVECPLDDRFIGESS